MFGRVKHTSLMLQVFLKLLAQRKIPSLGQKIRRKLVCLTKEKYFLFKTYFTSRSSCKLQ